MSLPVNRSRANTSVNCPTSLSPNRPVFLSQSFVSIPRTGGSVGRRRNHHRPSILSSPYSSHTQLLSTEYHHSRRLTSPGLSQPAEHLVPGGALHDYDPLTQDLDMEEVFTHEAFLSPVSQWAGAPRSGSRGEEEGALMTMPPRREEGRVGGGGLVQEEGWPLRLNSRSLSQRSINIDSHEEAHIPGISHTPARYVMSQPGYEDLERFPPVSNVSPRKHLTVASRHPRSHQTVFSMTQFTPEVTTVEREVQGRTIFQRTGSFTPLRQPQSLHGTAGMYQPRNGLNGNKPSGPMSSNGSIATSTADSAYASGLSNQFGIPRSPSEPEGTHGSGMRSEGGERVGHHPLQPSTSGTSHASLTGSRDSSRGGNVNEEEGPQDWEVSYYLL